jgi:hypothetical protein
MLKTFLKNSLIILFTAFLIIPLILMLFNYYTKPSYYEGFNSFPKPSYSFEFRNDVSNATVVDSISGEVSVTLSGGAYYDLSGIHLDGASALALLDSFEMGGSDMTFEVYVKYDNDSPSWGTVYQMGSIDKGEDSALLFQSNDYNRVDLELNNDPSLFANSAMSDDEWMKWHHYVGIFSSTNGSSLYLNGNEEATNTTYKTVPTRTTRQYNSIGSSPTGEYFMSGTVAYMRIWDGTALNETDISYLYSKRETRDLSFVTITDLSMVITSTTSGVTNNSTTADSFISLIFTSNESTNDFDVNDITVTGGSLSNFSGTGTTYIATFTPSGNGQCTIDVLEGTFTDFFGNTNSASTSFVWTYNDGTSSGSGSSDSSSSGSGSSDSSSSGSGSSDSSSSGSGSSDSSSSGSGSSDSSSSGSGSTSSDSSSSGSGSSSSDSSSSGSGSTSSDSSSSGSGSGDSSSSGSGSGSSSSDSSSSGSGTTTSETNPFVELLSSDELKTFLSGIFSQYSSDSQTISGDNVQSYDWSSSSNIKCVADNGSVPGNNLCCGQEGVLQDTKYICPSEYPNCEGYVCGETWGKCKATRSTSGTTTGMTYGQWVGST